MSRCRQLERALPGLFRFRRRPATRRRFDPAWLPLLVSLGFVACASSDGAPGLARSDDVRDCGVNRCSTDNARRRATPAEQTRAGIPPARAALQPEGLEATMKNALQQYIDGFNRGDAALLASLFADDATIEDPVGGGRIVEGKEAITAFYLGAVERVERLVLDAPIRGSHGRSAAMAFTIHLAEGEERRRIRAVDVMSFDASGRIVEMRAYHGPSDVIE